MAVNVGQTEVTSSLMVGQALVIEAEFFGVSWLLRGLGSPDACPIPGVQAQPIALTAAGWRLIQVMYTRSRTTLAFFHCMQPCGDPWTRMVMSPR